MGLGRGLAGLFKKWGKGIGNAADHVWLREEAQKAIKDEVTKKFQPKIDIAHGAESKRAANIKDLDAKLTQSKADLAAAQKAWKDKYDAELAAAQTKRQTDIADYSTQLQAYKKALADAKAGRDSIVDQLRASEAGYNKFKTIFTDVTTGEAYKFDPSRGKYVELSTYYQKLKPKQQQAFDRDIQSYDTRLFDFSTGRVLNAFDEPTRKLYKGNSVFDNYYPTKISAQDAAALKDAENQIKLARGDLTNWQNKPQPQAWDDKKDLSPFDADFRKNNVEPTEYSFNGKNYKSEPELDAAYQKALNHAQYKRDKFKTKASDYASQRDAEIAQRIQDAKDMNKAKVFLGGTLGAGALYAAGKAMYGSDDTDNTDNTDNINNINNTDYGNPDPKLKAENTPEGKAAIIGKSLIDTDFDPDKADAVATLAAASHDEGVKDSNSIESSDDRFIDDDELYGLLKAMEDPHKADAVANYIYSKHGNESDVQRLGWRGWLNKYYGDVLRSRMGLDPSSYNGMHISGGL